MKKASNKLTAATKKDLIKVIALALDMLPKGTLTPEQTKKYKSTVIKKIKNNEIVNVDQVMDEFDKITSYVPR